MPTASVDRVEDIWQRALDLEILTIAIGDGGNELGMGKVHEEIITTIPEGDLIGKLSAHNYDVINHNSSCNHVDNVFAHVWRVKLGLLGAPIRLGHFTRSVKLE